MVLVTLSLVPASFAAGFPRGFVTLLARPPLAPRLLPVASVVFLAGIAVLSLVYGARVLSRKERRYWPGYSRVISEWAVSW